MIPLKNFLMPLEIRMANEETFEFGVKAYGIDKCLDTGISLKNQLRMDNFNSCDYIFITEEVIFLLEDSNLKAKKDDLQNNCLRSVKDDASKEKLLRKIISDEQILKAYAGLLLLCRLISQSKEAMDLMKGKKKHFWVIINDDDPSDPKGFDYLGEEISKTLRPLVSKVAVLGHEKANRILCKYHHSSP